ncbi:hypothetical protein V1282_005775 [Nitrobacteraceae bacterium AZCC 2146]
MTDENTPSGSDTIADVKAVVTDGVKVAAARISEAIDEGRKPGKPLDLLSRITRVAPLGALLVAFLIGRALARRRR